MVLVVSVAVSIFFYFTVSVSSSGLHVPNSSKTFPVDSYFWCLSWTSLYCWQSTVSMRFDFNIGLFLPGHELQS